MLKVYSKFTQINYNVCHRVEPASSSAVQWKRSGFSDLEWGELPHEGTLHYSQGHLLFLVLLRIASPSQATPHLPPPPSPIRVSSHFNNNRNRIFHPCIVLNCGRRASMVLIITLRKNKFSVFIDNTNISD